MWRCNQSLNGWVRNGFLASLTFLSWRCWWWSPHSFLRLYQQQLVSTKSSNGLTPFPQLCASILLMGMTIIWILVDMKARGDQVLVNFIGQIRTAFGPVNLGVSKLIDLAHTPTWTVKRRWRWRIGVDSIPRFTILMIRIVGKCKITYLLQCSTIL